MLFQDTLFIGIDPPAGGQPLTYAALDKDLNLTALSSGELSDVAAFAGGQSAAVVGVNAPRRPNQGLMARDAVRDGLIPQPSPGRWTAFRVAEYQLFQHNIRIPRTPAKISACPGWIQTGFEVYKRLEEHGFQDYPAGEHHFQLLEVYPHAAYTALLKKIPFLKKTLEGRLQRQLLLHSLSLDVPDPMRVFEEITRFKIIQGQLPLDGLYSVEELEAIMAAYLAWKVSLEPDETSQVGDSREGIIFLPVRELRGKYV